MSGSLDTTAAPEAPDRWDYEPPEVDWVPVYENGVVVSFKESPEFGRDWDHLTTLRHLAALIEHRTGLKVRVAPVEPPECPDGTETLAVPIDDPEDCYDVLTAHTTGGPAPFPVAWAWLSGFQTGIEEVKWKEMKG